MGSHTYRDENGHSRLIRLGDKETNGVYAIQTREKMMK